MRIGEVAALAGLAVNAELHRRLDALADADPGDPRGPALAEFIRQTLRLMGGDT